MKCHPIATLRMRDEAPQDEPEAREAARRRGLLNAVIQHFSSTPLDPSGSIPTFRSSGDPDLSNSITTQHQHHLQPPPNDRASPSGAHHPLPHHPNRFSSTPLLPPRASTSSILTDSGILTDSERGYLEGLLRAGDAADIEAAGHALSNADLFFADPPEDDDEQKVQEEEVPDEEGEVEPGARDGPTVASVSRPPPGRRDSRVQQQLFRLHETKAVPPSRVLQRLTLVHRNSLLMDSFSEDATEMGSGYGNVGIAANSIVATSLDQDEDALVTGDDAWDPFQDVASWLDGSQGVEIRRSGSADAESALASRPPFKILGTSADDASCHPHVLSPPLMESLLAFVPEGWTECNWWLKFSLSRDGGGLRKLLRQVRASTATIVALETTEGHVLGSFTSLPWRFSSGWYGAVGGTDGSEEDGACGASSASFVWKMRRNRCLDAASRSIVQQVCQESEIQVYPYRPSSTAVQYCSATEGLMLGQKELVLPTKELSGAHHGHALCIAPDLKSGTTSTSETFGNPCLVQGELRGARFDIANLEVWTLTPHSDVADAEQSELSNLFLDGGRTGSKLHLFNILVGQPI